MHISKLVDYVKNKISFSKEFCEDNAFVTLRIEPILKILENLEQSHKDILEYVEKIEKYKYLYKKALDNTIQADRENIQLKKQIDLMVKAMNKIQDPQICKYCDNNINLNNGYCTDAKKCKEGVKKYFERKVKKWKSK